MDVRTNRLEHANKTGHQVHVHEIEPGVVYQEAAEAKPGLLVLYHQVYWSPTPEGQLPEEVRQRYAGKVASARDLDVY